MFEKIHALGPRPSVTNKQNNNYATGNQLKATLKISS